MIHRLGDIAAIIGAVAATVTCIAYHLSARWWESEEGRHLMSFTAALAVYLDWASYRILTSQAALLKAGDDVARTVVFASVAVLLVWRFLLLGRRQIWASWRRAGAGRGREEMTDER